MKTFTARSRTFLALGAVLATATPPLFAADVVLQKVPALTVDQAPAYPENLARLQLGATIETGSNAAAGVKSAQSALLGGDPTATYPIPAGKTTLLVALPMIENISTVSFANQGAKGSIAISTASAKLPASSPQWHEAARQDLTSDDLRVKIGPGEAKYVRLTFDLTEPGTIAGFGIYADPRVSDFTSPRVSKSASDQGGKFALVSYNYTDMHAKARALYVSSGSDVHDANKMIDDQTSTTYRFAAGDGSPTTVIDLGKAVELRRLSAVYAAQAGKMEFYVLKALPGVNRSAAPATASGASIPAPDSPPSTVTLSDTAFADLKAVGSASDDGSQGRASVEFPATSGRYLMVRWVPSAPAQTSFALAELAAFGNGSRNTLLAANTEVASGGEYDGKTMQDGKTMEDPKDAKDMPGEGAEDPPAEGPPPSLPDPPPFTFVPLLVPTSP